ncbi:MAG: hypothetical protein HYV63_33255 [Candidatus Schekmanbacteria bacterium]|nr:hypothetical protein [Candidatus Schekmanbacteria bacterium]
MRHLADEAGDPGENSGLVSSWSLWSTTPLFRAHPCRKLTVKEKRHGRLVTLSTRILAGAQHVAARGLVISTALIERLNLTLRRALAPLARKTYSFCKDREQMQRRVTFFQAFYNVARPHQSLRTHLPMEERHRTGAISTRWRQRTPAMAAGLTDHVWTFRELLTAKFAPLYCQSTSG